MTHHELLLKLEIHLRDFNKVLWREPNFQGWGPRNGLGSPDILTVRKSYTNPNWHVYEVKASQSDLLSDLRVNKFERYYPLCERLTFAVHHSIDWKKHLQPIPGVGIMVFQKNGRWHTKRAARKHGGPYPDIDVMALSLLFGRMSLNKVDYDGPRVCRLDREREVLLSRQIETLVCSANNKLSEFARSLSFQEKSIERDRKNLSEEKEKLKEIVKQELHKEFQEYIGLQNKWRIYEPKDAIEKVLKDTIDKKIDGIKLQAESFFKV